MNDEQITLVIDRKLHHQIKLAALRRKMKLQEFVDYIIRKGLNLTSRKQP